MDTLQQLLVDFSIDGLGCIRVSFQLFLQFVVLILQHLVLIADPGVAEVLAIVLGLELVDTFLQPHDLGIFIGQLVEEAAFIFDNELVVRVYLRLFP